MSSDTAYTAYDAEGNELSGTANARTPSRPAR